MRRPGRTAHEQGGERSHRHGNDLRPDQRAVAVVHPRSHPADAWRASTPTCGPSLGRHASPVIAAALRLRAPPPEAVRVPRLAQHAAGASVLRSPSLVGRHACPRLGREARQPLRIRRLGPDANPGWRPSGAPARGRWPGGPLAAAGLPRHPRGGRCTSCPSTGFGDRCPGASGRFARIGILVSGAPISS